MKLNLNTCIGHAQGIIVPRQDVACWPTTAGGIFVDGSAAIRFEDLDISPYEGVAGTLTNYKIKLYDNDLYVCEGYLAEADTALALGAEIVDNGAFETDPNVEWTIHAARCTIDSIAGGQVANCLEITEVDAAGQYIYENFTGTIGTLYFFSRYVKSGTAGNISSAAGLYTTDIGASKKRLDVNSSASWVQSTFYWIADATGLSVGLCKAIGAGTMLFDEVSLKPVTHVGTDGCHVVSTKNGSTRNWAYKDAAFNYNDPDGYKAEILIAK